MQEQGRSRYSHYLPQTLRTDICLCIIEEVLNKLFILKRLSNASKEKKVDESPNKTMLKKYMDKADVEEVDTGFECNLVKFEKDFDFLEKTLQTAFDELKNKGTCESLLEVINTLKQSKTEEVELKVGTKTNQIDHKKLECTLYEEEIFYHNKIAECMADIGKIKDEIEDFLVEGEIKTEYVEKWQNSKIEMRDILLERKEEEKTLQLKKLDRDVYKESRVHHEILAAYREMEKDIQCEIDKWEEKYTNDRKEIEGKIQSLQDKREKQREATIMLKERYAKREQEMNDFKKYKVKMEEKRMELQRQHEAATKIQAWWRGTMVRKGFGKYRKKKDKKGKKK